MKLSFDIANDLWLQLVDATCALHGYEKGMIDEEQSTYVVNPESPEDFTLRMIRDSLVAKVSLNVERLANKQAQQKAAQAKDAVVGDAAAKIAITADAK